MLCANGEYIAFLDADCPVDLEFFSRTVNELKSKNIPIGIASRYHSKSKIISKTSILRKISSKVFLIIIRYYFHLKEKDTQCGCKIFHKNVVHDLFYSLLEKGFAFDIELLHKAHLNDFEVLESPCILKNDVNSTVNPLRDSFKMLISLYKIKYHYSKK